MANRVCVALACALAAASVAGAGTARAQAPTSVPRPSPAAQSDQVETRITELHARFRITPAQEALWATFTKVMRDNSTRMGGLYLSRNPQTLSAPDALAHYAAISRAHAEEIDNLIPPFGALYESMDTTQKKAADEAFHSFERRAGRLR